MTIHIIDPRAGWVASRLGQQVASEPTCRQLIPLLETYRSTKIRISEYLKMQINRIYDYPVYMVCEEYVRSEYKCS